MRTLIVLLTALVLPAPASLAQPLGGPAPKSTTTPKAGAEPAPAKPPAQPEPAKPPPPAANLPPPPSQPPAAGRPRVAISEFSVEGDGGAPALTLQLLDGFVLGLVRAGIDVLDSVDVSKKLEAAPELDKCESSPCLKRMGEVLAVRFVLRVRVVVTGNSYRMTARLFSTEGAAPAALPLATQTRPCDVCTVAEAREQMIRLADAVRMPIEEKPGPPPAPPPPPVSTPSRAWPITGIVASVLAVAGGVALFALAEDDAKPQVAAAGALVGAGAATGIFSVYFTVVRSPNQKPVPRVALGFRY